MTAAETQLKKLVSQRETMERNTAWVLQQIEASKVQEAALVDLIKKTTVAAEPPAAN